MFILTQLIERELMCLLLRWPVVDKERMESDVRSIMITNILILGKRYWNGRERVWNGRK